MSDQDSGHDRLDALTRRVDQIEPRLHDTRRIAEEARDEAASARRGHVQNVRLLNAVRETQAEHTATLAQHGTILERHGDTLTQHGRMLEEHSTILGRLLVGVHSIETILTRLVEREDD